MTVTDEDRRAVAAFVSEPIGHDDQLARHFAAHRLAGRESMRAEAAKAVHNLGDIVAIYAIPLEPAPLDINKGENK